MERAAVERPRPSPPPAVAPAPPPSGQQCATSHSERSRRPHPPAGAAVSHRAGRTRAGRVTTDTTPLDPTNTEARTREKGNCAGRPTRGANTAARLCGAGRRHWDLPDGRVPGARRERSAGPDDDDWQDDHHRWFRRHAVLACGPCAGLAAGRAVRRDAGTRPRSLWNGSTWGALRPWSPRREWQCHPCHPHRRSSSRCPSLVRSRRVSRHSRRLSPHIVLHPLVCGERVRDGWLPRAVSGRTCRHLRQSGRAYG